jgi:signal transduction histidine kinase
MSTDLSTQNESEFDRMARYLDILHHQCNKQLELINDLLDLQRLNAEAYLLEPTLIRLQDWLPHIAEAFLERIQSRQQQLQIDIPADLPSVVIDRPTLTRIFTELLNNACKYTPPGEQITVTAAAMGNPTVTIQLTISNTRAEIPARELPLIFDQFYRVQGSDQWNQGGTGLGLALVRKMVIYLGGAIRAESTAGQTTFIVELPIAPST